jgi:adenine-specific DNA-methyltransferase
MAKTKLEIDAIRHMDASRLNIPTAEYESIMRDEDKSPIQVAYERRNRDLDPQLVWRGKDTQDWSDLVVNAPPLYIQEKVHPKVLIDDLRRKSREDRKCDGQVDLFADFNGLKDKEAATEFYQHDQHWSNRMILGDSLAVMASLAEREGLRGKVQCIYFDPPYGIKFNSNFQWSTTSRDVKDGSKDHVTREPEMVKAFRDTWRNGIHSYLTYMRDRLTVARDLLHESGSIFVQIGDENAHRVRTLLDEIFGSDNSVATIIVSKNSGATDSLLPSTFDYVLWFAKSKSAVKYRQLYHDKSAGSEYAERYKDLELENGVRRRTTPAESMSASEIPHSARLFALHPAFSQGFRPKTSVPFRLQGRTYDTGNKRNWATSIAGMQRLAKINRLVGTEKNIYYVRYLSDFPAYAMNSIWSDTQDRLTKTYVVQTVPKVIQRCIMMTTDPGDLVLDPTCGSGTTAHVAEQWGRRWVTIDTSRVSLALARSRIMGARYSYYILADSPAGQKKEGEVTRTPPKTTPTHGNIRHGFVYERVPHITLKSIANNTEIDVIWDKWQETLEPIRASLNKAVGKAWEEWEIPREADTAWGDAAKKDHAAWWEGRIARQKEIDASIAAKADFEYLYDKPYVDSSRVRVAGPFTVESLSPHRVLVMSDSDELIDILEASEGKLKADERDPSVKDFAEMVLENLRAAGVQQAHKDARIAFTSITGWPGGRLICAEGRYLEGDMERRAGILVGPEFGTVSRPDLVAAAREAGDAGFDIVVACAFNFDAHSAEFDRLGKVPVLKARMNPDLMMGGELKATGAGNLFIVFGEPDIKLHETQDGQIQVQVFGVDVFKPQTGEVVSEDTDGIALWMIDTDYNEESFFVRHCYFLGANDPYKALKTTLKAEIDQEAWDSLNSDTSRPFPKPKSGRIAVKVINHLGDEVMKVFSV